MLPGYFISSMVLSVSATRRGGLRSIFPSCRGFCGRSSLNNDSASGADMVPARTGTADWVRRTHQSRAR
jgi:hypothetical protein